MIRVEKKTVEATRREALRWEYDHSGAEEEVYQEQVALRKGAIRKMEREIEQLENLMTHTHEFVGGRCLVCKGLKSRICIECHTDRVRQS